MITLPPFKITAGGSFTIPLDTNTIPGNPATGIVLGNNSGYLLTVTCGGSSLYIQPWTADYLPVNASTAASALIQVGSLLVGAPSNNPEVTVTVYQSNDPPPSGYPIPISSQMLNATIANELTAILAGGWAGALTGIQGSSTSNLIVPYNGVNNLLLVPAPPAGYFNYLGLITITMAYVTLSSLPAFDIVDGGSPNGPFPGTLQSTGTLSAPNPPAPVNLGVKTANAVYCKLDGGQNVAASGNARVAVVYDVLDF